MEYKVLVIEDSQVMAKFIGDSLRDRLGMEAILAHSKKEAEEKLAQLDSKNLFALSDLNLPDSPYEGALSLCLQKKIPTIVLSSSYQQETRDRILSRKVVDYVIKTNTAIDQIIYILKRLKLNRGITVLIVDDSPLFRKEQSNLLKLMQFQVLEATNGVEALQILEQHPEITLVVTDLEMPQMDGLQLTEEIRKLHNKEQVAVIGISAHGNQHTSVQFIKRGANDFIKKPFLQEEFNQRIQLNVELVEYMRELYFAANFDFLTRLHNRKYFFENAAKLRREGKGPFALAMLDLDHFKQINDTHGHDAGDEVLKQFSELMTKTITEAKIISRIGGEEFCIFFAGEPEGKIKAFLNGLRSKVEQTPVQVQDKEVSFTVSIGVALGDYDNLDQMLMTADRNLYLAKEQGRNRMLV